MTQTIIDQRYYIQQELGKGGMGIVYKVLDSVNNTELALKTLPTMFRSPDFFNRFKTEFITIAGLKHPNLVEVFDFGIDAHKIPYFTMEYIEGVSLNEFPHVKDLALFLPLVIQVCEALEYIHARGFIHRDIKPTNILITKESTSLNFTAKLTDFGLATSPTGKPLDLPGGTASYMAPEVLRNERIDHLSDLFSLGVVLYRVLADSLPIRVKKPTSFLIQGLKEVSPPPLEFNDTIPEELNTLILLLLHPDPEARYQSAAEVKETLFEILGKLKESKRVHQQEQKLYFSQFIGREQHLKELFDEYEQVLQSHSRVLALSGETGIGKSRLLKEFKNDIQIKHHPVFMTQFYARSIYAPLNQLFESLVHFSAGRNKNLLKEFLPYLETIIPSIQKTIPDHSHLDLVLLDPQSEKVRLQDGLLRFIETLSKTYPLVIIFEDLHNASADDIDFIKTMIARIEKSQILLIFSYTSDNAISNTAFHNFRASLHHLPQLKTLHLERFDYALTQRLIDSIMGETVTNEELYSAIYDKTEGNLLYVEEYLKLLVKKGGIVRAKKEWKFDQAEAETIPVPKSIQEVLTSKLEGLTAAELVLLRYCAGAGRGFAPSLIGKATQAPSASIRALMNKLVRNVIIEPMQSPETDYYVFTHGTYQDIIYQETPVSLRKKIHLALGRTLESDYQDSSPIPLKDIALHFLYGRDYEKGISYALDYVSYLLSIYAHARAIFYLNEILAALTRSRSPKLKERYIAQTYLLLRETYMIIGDWGNALSMNKKIRNSPYCHEEKGTNYYYGAQVYYKKGEYKTALRQLSLTKKVVPAEDTSLLTGQIKLLESTTLERRGRNEEAIKICQEAINIFEQASRDDLLAAAYNAYAKMYATRGDVPQVIKCLRKSLKIRRSLNDRFGEGSCLNNLAMAFYDLGKVQVAIKLCQKSQAINEEIGHLQCLGKNYSNLAYFYNELGESEKVLENQYTALKIYKSINDTRGQAVSFNNIAIAHRIRGEFSESENFFLESLDLKKKIGDTEILVNGYQNLGRLYLIVGRFDEALHCHKTALLLAKRTDNIPLLALSYTFLASDYLFIGDFIRAERYLKIRQKVVGDLLIDDLFYENYSVAAQISIKKGDWSNAHKHIKKYLEKVGQRGNIHGEGVGLRLLAEWYLNTRKPEEAKTWYERALECFRRTENPYELALTYKKFGESLVRDEPEKAKDLLLKAQHIFRKINLSHEGDEVNRYITEIDRMVVGENNPDRNLEILLEANKAMMSIPDLDQLLNFLIDKALLISGAQRGLLVLLDEKYRLKIKVIRHFTDKEFDDNTHFSSSIIQEVLITKQPLYIEDITSDHRFQEKTSVVNLDIRSVISIPLLSPKIHHEISRFTDETSVERDIIGVIYLDSQVKQHVFTEYDLNSVIALANDAAIAIENTNLFHLATIDGLTRTYIYRYFQQRLKEELLRASRFHRNLALLMIDIDHFKKYNDRYGHQAGNLMLRTIAYEIKTLLRSSDILSRFGGEEFTLIMPETSNQGAYIVAERIRKHIENLEINDSKTTISIGIACFPEHDIQGRGDFIEKSDFALYQAKLRGRNRTMLFNPKDLDRLSRNETLFVPHDSK